MVYISDRNDLSNILLHNNADDILYFGDKILELVPELIICNKCEHEHKAHKYNVFRHTLHVVSGVENDLTLKLAALFHDIGKPYVKKKVNDKIHYHGHEDVSVDLTRLILRRLSYEEELIKEVCLLVKFHDTKVTPSIEGVQAMSNNIGKKNLEKLFKLQTSDILAHADYYAEIIMPKLKRIIKFYEDNKYKQSYD